MNIGTLIILALSNLATMLMTARLLYCRDKGISPIPSLPRRADETESEDDNHRDPVYEKGRPIV